MSNKSSPNMVIATSGSIKHSIFEFISVNILSIRWAHEHFYYFSSGTDYFLYKNGIRCDGARDYLYIDINSLLKSACVLSILA